MNYQKLRRLAAEGAKVRWTKSGVVEVLQLSFEHPRYKRGVVLAISAEDKEAGKAPHQIRPKGDDFDFFCTVVKEAPAAEEAL